VTLREAGFGLNDEDTHKPWDGVTFTAPETGTYIFGEALCFQEDGSTKRIEGEFDQYGRFILKKRDEEV
jgi:hypothetical protein